MAEKKNVYKKNTEKAKTARKPFKGEASRKSVPGNPQKRTGVKENGNDKSAAVKKSRCPYFKKCGACQMIDTPYKKQLNLKHARLAELLEPYTRVESFIGMEEPEHYRCKVHAVFSHDRKGNPISGIYKFRL